MKRPRITTRCVADHYASKPVERIAEVYDPETGLGCLIAIRRTGPASMSIDVYRMDEGIEVNASGQREKPY